MHQQAAAGAISDAQAALIAAALRLANRASGEAVLAMPIAAARQDDEARVGLPLEVWGDIQTLHFEPFGPFAPARAAGLFLS
ncbi:MAG: hypothetical protein NXI12_14420 [Alphaproteobacteria bacterium]|nr:hypothetical protein [Alphaproteobacteria bacterium]